MRDKTVGAGPVLSLPKPALSCVEAGLPCPETVQQAAPLRLHHPESTPRILRDCFAAPRHDTPLRIVTLPSVARETASACSVPMAMKVRHSPRNAPRPGGAEECRRKMTVGVEETSRRSFRRALNISASVHWVSLLQDAFTIGPACLQISDVIYTPPIRGGGCKVASVELGD